MFCSARSFSSEARFRANMPAWTAGCRVLTRPASISGALVIADMSLNSIFVVSQLKIPDSSEGLSVTSLLNWESRLPNHPCRSTRSQNSNILLDQTFGEVKQASLVIDRHNGNPLALRHICGYSDCRVRRENNATGMVWT